MRFFRFLLSAFIVGSLVLNFGCEDGTDRLGEGIDKGGNSGTFHTDTLYVQQVTAYRSFMDSLITASGDRLFLGTVDNYDFRILMQFYITDHDLDSFIVTAARIKLITSGAFGPGGTMTARFHSVQKPWGVADMAWDRFQEGTDYGAAYQPTNIAYTAADKQTVIIPINRDTVQRWVNILIDTSTANPVVNRGILIDAPGATFVQQFYSGNILKLYSGGYDLDTALVARLEFDYQHYDRETNTLETGTRSVTPSSIASIGHYGGLHGFLYRDRSPQPSNTLTVGGGLPYHALMQFDVSKLPPDLTVSKAMLQMVVDPAGNYLRSSGDSALISIFGLEVDTADWKPAQILTSNRFLFSDNVRDDTLYANIGSLVQDWASDTSHNYGLQLEHGNEYVGNFSKLYRLRFFYNPSDPVISPKIIISYTLPPQ